MSASDQLELINQELQDVIKRLKDFIEDNEHKFGGFDNSLSEINYAIDELLDIKSWIIK